MGDVNIMDSFHPDNSQVQSQANNQQEVEDLKKQLKQRTDLYKTTLARKEQEVEQAKTNALNQSMQWEQNQKASLMEKAQLEQQLAQQKKDYDNKLKDAKEQMDNQLQAMKQHVDQLKQSLAEGGGNQNNQSLFLSLTVDKQILATDDYDSEVVNVKYSEVLIMGENDSVCQVWTIRNTGKKAWDYKQVSVNMKQATLTSDKDWNIVETAALPQTVAPGQYCKVQIKFPAPSSGQMQTAHYKLFINNQSFGQEMTFSAQQVNTRAQIDMSAQLNAFSFREHNDKYKLVLENKLGNSRQCGLPEINVDSDSEDDGNVFGDKEGGDDSDSDDGNAFAEVGQDKEMEATNFLTAESPLIGERKGQVEEPNQRNQSVPQTEQGILPSPEARRQTMQWQSTHTQQTTTQSMVQNIQHDSLQKLKSVDNWLDFSTSSLSDAVQDLVKKDKAPPKECEEFPACEGECTCD